MHADLAEILQAAKDRQAKARGFSSGKTGNFRMQPPPPPQPKKEIKLDINNVEDIPLIAQGWQVDPEHLEAVLQERASANEPQPEDGNQEPQQAPQQQD